MTTPRAWTHRKVGDWWCVYWSNDQLGAQFAHEGDALAFVDLAGPVPPFHLRDRAIERVAEILRRHHIDGSANDRAQDADHCACGPLVEDWDEHWARALDEAGWLRSIRRRIQS